MIGRLRFQWAGEELTAELSDDLAWSCDHPVYGAQLAGWLTTLFDPRDDLSPSRGAPGFKALADAAEWLGVEVEGLISPESKEHDGLY